MFIAREWDEGMAAVAGEAMTSGQLVVLSLNSDGKIKALKIGGGTALDGSVRIGLAYVDNAKKINLRPVALDNASLTSNENEAIASGEVITVLTGRLRGMTNQLVDGYYSAGQPLTIDGATAKFKAAATTDKIFARVSLTEAPGKVTSGDKMVSIAASVGGVGGVQVMP